MKKVFLCLLASIVTICFAINFSDPTEYKIVSIEEIAKSDSFQEFEFSADFIKQVFNESDQTVVFLINKGTKLSLNFFIKGEFFSCNSPPLPEITVEKDFYIKMYKRKFLYSDDLKKWYKSSHFFHTKGLMGIQKNLDNIQINLGTSINKK